MTDELGALKRELGETQSLLLEHHAYYRQSIKDRFWYDDPMLIRFGDRGPVDADLDLSGMTVEVDRAHCNEHGYWLPHADLRQHIVDRAKDEIGRLKPLEPGRPANPEFAHFHSPFPQELADCEINDTVRLNHDLESGGIISLAKATYLDQVGTNITADVPILPPAGRRRASPLTGRTCRQLDTLDDGQLKPLSECIQANTIGVTAVAVDRDNRIIARFRKGTDLRSDDVQQRLGAMRQGWHCFSSGVLEWSDIAEGAASASTAKFCDGLTEGMRREIWYETGFARDSDDYSIVPYGFARELKRPGKPQFFFLTKFHNMTAEEVCARVEENHEAGRIREAGEYGALEQNWFQNVVRMMLRKRKPPAGCWIIELEGSKGLDRDELRRISDDGFAGETLTYEFYGALFLLRGRDINSFFRR
jgi:hypothetical protein